MALGIISDRGAIPAADVAAALERAGVLAFFDPALIVYGRKDSALIFEAAAARVPDGPRRLLFVGERAQERAFAQAAGFAVSPHPRLAPRMLLGPGLPLRYLRIRVPDVPDWRARLRALPVVPLHVAAGAAVPELYAVANSATALQLDDAGFWVDRLGADDAPATSELFLLRADGLTDDAGAAVAFAAADGDTARGVLASTAEGLLVAIPAGRSIDFLHLGAARHGHNLKLTAMPALLAEPAAEPHVAAAEPPPPPDPDVVELVRAEVTEAGLAETVGRYSGTLPLVAGTTLRSRHIQHPDNAGAVAGLVADLTALGGLAVRTHRFTHAGRPLDNVEAHAGGLRAARCRPGDGAPGLHGRPRPRLPTGDRSRPRRGRRRQRHRLRAGRRPGRAGPGRRARRAASRGALRAVQRGGAGAGREPGVRPRPSRAGRGHRGGAAARHDRLRRRGRAGVRAAREASAVRRGGAAVGSSWPAGGGGRRGGVARPAGPQVNPQTASRTRARAAATTTASRSTGSPACLASEDFFVGPGPGPDAGSNPNYHRGRRDRAGSCVPAHCGRHGRRVAQRHREHLVTHQSSRNAASSAVKASGLSWLLACPGPGRGRSPRWPGRPGTR